MAGREEHRLDFSLSSPTCLGALYGAQLYAGVLQGPCHDFQGHGTSLLFPSLISLPTLISILSSHTGLLVFPGAPGILLIQALAKVFLH